MDLKIHYKSFEALALAIEDAIEHIMETHDWSNDEGNRKRYRRLAGRLQRSHQKLLEAERTHN